jgi:DNA-binding response OmpR family regulator
MRKLKVLIGDSDSGFCHARKALLEYWGFDVIEASDGKEACATLISAHVDFCILDWDLPRMTGIEACRWIRSVELKTQPYIILLTEKGNPEQTRAAYLAGANDFIAKPFNLEDLHFLVSIFAQKVLQQDVVSQQLTQLDPLELYRRDLTTPKIHSRV